MIRRIAFFNRLRTYHLYTKMIQGQVDSFNAIIDFWEEEQYDDIRWLAYMLATAYHETARTMLPIEEYGKGKGRPYGRKLRRDRYTYETPDKLYYGRGLVQLTWYENYDHMGTLLGIDLLKNPELALVLDNAVKIMFEGMLKAKSTFGDFTGKCLENYFNDKVEDPLNARRIINGVDCAAKIAGHYDSFKKCLV